MNDFNFQFLGNDDSVGVKLYSIFGNYRATTVV